MPSDINLLQNQLTADSTLKVKGLLSKVEIGLFVAVIFALLAGAGLFILNRMSVGNQAKTAQEIERRKVELASAASEKRNSVVKVQSQLDNIGKLLPEHIYWTQVFKLLNASSLAGLQFSQISVSANDGRAVVSGQASDFNTIAAFTKKLGAQPGVAQVTINSSSLSDTGQRTSYTFSVTATFDKGVFRYPQKQ